MKGRVPFVRWMTGGPDSACHANSEPSRSLASIARIDSESKPAAIAARFTVARARRYHRRRMEPTVRIPAAAPSHVRVPPELEGLRRLAYNLYWSWHPQARALYARIN